MPQDAMNRMGYFVICTIFTLSVAFSASAASTTYATKYGLGPDKWATAWLLTRHVDSESQLSVIESVATVPQDAILFDDPKARTAFQRTSDISAFQGVAQYYDLDTPVIQRLKRIIYEMEVAFWQTDTAVQTDLVEHGFRRLQEVNGRTSVSAQCYLRFFDSVEQTLNAHDSGELFPLDALLSRCESSRAVTTASKADAHTPSHVREVELEAVLSAIDRGKRVVFVDVREPSEFHEQHIPGALNIPIRDLNETTLSQIGPADYVVSYCVKDFRGYEMAKLLARAGAQNSVIMNPYGLKGWMSSGLPVAGQRALARDEASRQLTDCAATGHCLKR